MFPTSCPTPSSLRSCASPTSSVPSSGPFSRFGTLPPLPSTLDDEFILRSPRFSINVPLMTASASSPRPSCNHSRIQWNGPYHFPPIIGIGIVLRNLWRREWSTRQFSPSPLPSLPHKTPHAPNQCSSPVTRSTTPINSLLHHLSLLHSPLPSLLLANDKTEEASYQTTHHRVPQRSSAPYLSLLSLSLPLLVNELALFIFRSSPKSFHSRTTHPSLSLVLIS